MLSYILVLTTFFALMTAAQPTAASSPLQPGEVPSISMCQCERRADNEYTVEVWIVNKTTSEDGMLSQGLRDNVNGLCKGYFILWSDVEPIGKNMVTGETMVAEIAPPTLRAHVYTGFLNLVVTGYVVRIDLEGKKYDGCVSEAIEQAENMNVTCPCPSGN